MDSKKYIKQIILEEYYELVAQEYAPDCENCDEID